MTVSKIPDQMQAAWADSYGTSANIGIRSIPTPLPGAEQVVVKVIAVGLNALDMHLHRGRPWLVRTSAGFTRPKRTVPGLDLAGVVVRVGEGCTRLKPGDAVFGQAAGALAEYAIAKESSLQLIPGGVSYIHAAASPVSGVTALAALNAASVAAGTSVLVHGASGGVGTLTTQLAAERGAVVTASCSAKNAEVVRTLGASTILDYARDKLLDSVKPYDAIVDVVGNLPLRKAVRSMTSGGTVVRVGFGGGDWFGPIRPFIEAPLASLGASGRIVVLSAKASPDALVEVADLLRTGTLTPVIETVYPLEDIRTAFARLESGRTVGKSVVRIAPDPS